MPGSFFPSTGGGANVNLNKGLEFFGYNADGTLTSVTGSSANNLGAWTTLGSAAVNALAGIWIDFGVGATSSSRVQVDVAYLPSGGVAGTDEVVVVVGASAMPITTQQTPPIWCAVNIPAGALIRVRTRCGSGSEVNQLAVKGEIRTASSPPLWTKMTGLNLNTGATRGTDVPLNSSGAGGSFTPLVADTSLATPPGPYGAISYCFSDPATYPNANRYAMVELALGASGSEVVFDKAAAFASSSFGALHLPSRFIEKVIASGQRISARINVAAATTGGLGLVVYGYQ